MRRRSDARQRRGRRMAWPSGVRVGGSGAEGVESAAQRGKRTRARRRTPAAPPQRSASSRALAPKHPPPSHASRRAEPRTRASRRSPHALSHTGKRPAERSSLAQRTTPAARRAFSWPTMPWLTWRASSASSSPSPRMWLCAPMRSMRVRSFTSATFRPVSMADMAAAPTRRARGRGAGGEPLPRKRSRGSPERSNVSGQTRLRPLLARLRPHWRP